jgi:hypothetical protein
MAKVHSWQQMEAYYLWEIKGIVPYCVEDKILQLVDNVQQVFA